ncbi:MAG: pyridoxamine 5'-phosphate oxidase family protein [Mycobacterium sp.]
MSVKVDLDQLAEALSDFTFAYLITVGDDHRAHTVAVDPVLVDGSFELGSVGNSTRRNLTDRDGVTLLWPLQETDGYTLIVDGRGELGDTLRVVPQRAVLHRKAAPAQPVSGCGDDCVPL